MLHTRLRLGGFLLLFIPGFLAAQQNDFRSPSNPYYWKNKMPHPGYWQQDVHYTIKASLNDQTDIVTGSEQLVYSNNSPDTLYWVYFHLYQNAFQPGSYTEDMHLANKFPVKFGNYEQAGLGTKVSKVTVEGTEVQPEFDNTIMKVKLLSPLLPNASVKLTVDFETYFDAGGNIRRRMKMFKVTGGFKHYDCVHWYPRMCVYDRKFGWETDQHLTREFYGDFGQYDVELTIPNHYVLDGTGTLTNESEVLPADLREKLDIKNFVKKEPGSPAVTEIIKADGTTKTWRFHSINVHDFAFTADPTYRISEAKWNDIRCIALVQEPNAPRWQDAASFTARVIECYSRDFGMYIYPKMIVADARDGMEYPMLTLDGGGAPDYYDLIAHEVGHNWFFGMVGTNETYRALLDEGFTQFLTAWSCRKLVGEIRKRYKYKSDWVERFSEPDYYKNSEVYNGYIFDAAKGDETVITTHSDQFGGALRHGGGYRQVYMKTATMLYNLQYVLGDSLFTSAMKHYVAQWKIGHPYLEDFRNSIIQYTHVDLNWFFDQWLETSKTIDYGIMKIRQGNADNEYLVTFRRFGRMQMPLDFSVYSKEGKKYDYYVPNNWFEKKTTATVLPRWIGWDNIQKTYEAKLVIPGGIENIVIDTTERLADVNMLNNSKKLPLTVRFDSKIWNTPSWTEYDVRVRPDIWYNAYDGIKAGIWVGGDYMDVFNKFDIGLLYNFGIGQQLPVNAELNRYDAFSFLANYRTPTNKLIKNSAIYLQGKYMDGMQGALAGFEIKDRKEVNRFFVQFKMMYRASYDAPYLLYPDEWQLRQYNNSITTGIDHPYTYKNGTGHIRLQLRSTALGSSYDYQYANISAVNKNNLGKININTRLFAQFGTGALWAYESQLYSAGANPEELMDSKYTRSVGIFPETWGGYDNVTNHFHAGGGLNLRGYAGYVMPEYDVNSNLRATYKGTTGAAFNTELEFNELFSPLARAAGRVSSYIHIGTYLFGDIGVMNYNTPSEDLVFGDIRADAGVGTTLTIKKWGFLQTANPLTIRFDMPLFLNRTPNLDPDFVKFRWILGISRSF
ncbi:MAG: aminopeptidase N [Bacteroidetes bacterium]|nr:MAG: aminopeptidase N [Bacteroidota bacterium]